LFRRVIFEATTAVIKRIENGGGIRAGGFELKEFHPQDTQTQKEIIKEYVVDAPLEAGGALEEADGALEEADSALEEADGALEEADGALGEADGALEEADDALEAADGALEQVDEKRQGPESKRLRMASVSVAKGSTSPKRASASAPAVGVPPQHQAVTRKKNRDKVSFKGSTDDAARRKKPGVWEQLLQQQQATYSYMQAEDLAIRALQAEYKVNFIRNVSAGPGLEFDAVFTFDETIYVVEVKYVRSEITHRHINSTIEASFKLRSEKAKNKWSKVRMLLVFVLDEGVPVDSLDGHMTSLLSSSAVEVTTRFFSLAELRQRFGVSSG